MTSRALAAKPKTESPSTGVTAQARKQVADDLIDILADTYMLLVKTQVFHWNVVGSTFFSLHKLSEEHYNEMFEAIDEIAERIRSLGYVAPLNISGLIGESAISEEKSLHNAEQMVRQLVADHETLISRARDAAGTAEELDDYPTHDLLVRRMAFHEKAVWMFRAIVT